MVEQRFVIFSLNGEEFGIAVNIVREIVQPQKITKLPQSSELVEGIIYLRKSIVPIVDLKKRFYGVITEKCETMRLIIVKSGDWTVGIMVDDVLAVQSFSEQEISMLPPFVQRITTGCGLRGIGKLKKRLVILLDLTQTFSEVERRLLQKAVS